MDELKLDKKTTALVVIDLQKGIAGMPTVPHDPKTVISNSKKLADAFRANGMPVFLVHVVTGDVPLNLPSDETWKRPPGGMPADWADFVPEMTPQSKDVVIEK